MSDLNPPRNTTPGKEAPEPAGGVWWWAIRVPSGRTSIAGEISGDMADPGSGRDGPQTAHDWADLQTLFTADSGCQAILPLCRVLRAPTPEKTPALHPPFPGKREARRPGSQGKRTVVGASSRRLGAGPWIPDRRRLRRLVREGR